MNAVLITLSGSAATARRWLKDHRPDVGIVELPRSVLDKGSLRTRVMAIRRESPEVLLIMVEGLPWQYGQDALLYLGALAGAKRSILLDSRGRVRDEGRAGLLAVSPLRIARSFARGRRAITTAKRRLSALEVAVDTGRRSGHEIAEPIHMAYLRTTPAAGTIPGGATSHINGVVKGLIESGAEVTFIANDDVAGIELLPVRFQRIEPVPNVMPRAAFDVHNGLRFAERAVDLIEAARPAFIYERYSRFSIAGAEASLKLGIPLFLEYNGSEVWVGRHWDRTARLDLLERYERANLAAATRIFVISEIEKQNLIRAGIAEGKIIVNPNGVDPDVFRPDIGGESVRRQVGLAAETVVAGFLGTFGPWHGVLELADAIALAPRNARLTFLMIGDGSLRAQVEERLRDSGHLDRVVFTGVVGHDWVPALLDACDILISPHVPLASGAEFFGSPTKLFEYMAMGKGIVASRLGQIGDVLTDGENALLVEPGDAKGLSEAITRLAEDRELRKELGGRARAAAIARHTWQQNAQGVLDAYRGLA
jgi:glycosyltransferase involved in cell wall biosynthesis